MRRAIYHSAIPIFASVCCVLLLSVTAADTAAQGDDTGRNPLIAGPIAFVVCDDGSELAFPCGPLDPSGSLPEQPLAAEADNLRGFTALPNPATGRYIQGENDDPLAAFTRRPLDQFILPDGGLFLDENYEGPHYGVDYAAPDDYLLGLETPVYPIGPGYVTARSACVHCYVDGDAQGRVASRLPEYNFGFGSFVLVETPYNAYVSIYTMYAHLSRDLVSLGDYVTPDETLGFVGSSGYAQEFHVHLEIRYGPPGRFWNADFTQWATLDTWMATMFCNPALLVFTEGHPAMVTTLDEWIAQQPHAPDLP